MSCRALSDIFCVIEPNMDNPFMARAIRLSLDNVLTGQGGPFGAVIVKEGRIIAEGVNRVTAMKDRLEQS